MFALALLWALPAATVRACKCARTSSVADAKDTANAVFEGRVLRVSPIIELAERWVIEVEFKVVRTWKGLKSEEKVSVLTSPSSGGCGFPFEADRSYLVYATDRAYDAEKSDGRLHVYMCSRTKLLADAADDLSLLRAGVTTNNPHPSSAGCASLRASGNKAPGMYAAASTPFAFGAFVWRRRRQRK